MNSNFNYSYMARSSLTYISGFSVKFFFQSIYTDYANQAYFDKRLFKLSPLKPLNQIKPNLAGWVPFKIVTDSPALHSRWQLLLKIGISLIIYCYFIIGQNELKFYLQPHGHFQQYFGYIMATSFTGGRSQSTRIEPPTMGKQLGNFITCGCESSAPFFLIYKAGHEPTPYW